MKRLQKILFLSGLAFFGFLVWRIGARDLWRQFTELGWGLLPIIIAEGLAEFCHTISWRYCLSGRHRRISLWNLFRICLAGYAINFLTPTASLGGELTKGALLANDKKDPNVISALLLGKLSFGLGHLTFVIIGSAIVLSKIELPHALWLALLSSTGLLATGIITFLILQRRGKLGSLLNWFTSRRPRISALQKLSASLNEVDDALRAFHHYRPWDLWLSVFWHLVGYAFGIFSTWIFLRLLTNTHSLGIAANIWFLALWFDLITFAVPLNMGVLEGSRILVFRMFHLDPVLGLTCGLASRGAQLFWTIFGLISYGLQISHTPLSRKQIQSIVSENS